MYSFTGNSKQHTGATFNHKQSKIQHSSRATPSVFSWSFSRTTESTKKFLQFSPRKLSTHFQIYCSLCRYAVLIRRYWACVSLYINIKQLMYMNFIVVPCILITLMFLSPTNALLYYTYKILKYTAKISHGCSYMFRSIWTIIREPMPNLAKVTILCRCSVKVRR